MKPTEFLLRGWSAGRIVALLTFSIVVFASTLQAQSGRRLPNKNEAPPPRETGSAGVPAQPESAEKLSSEKPEKMQIMVVRFHSDFSTFYSDVVMRGCLDRLKADSSASVGAGRDMNRKEAGDYAKNSTNTYVVWLEWEYDRFGGGSQSDQGSYVNYALYVPVTGKQKTSGRVYQRDYRPGIGGVGIPVPNGPAGIEYSLRECGQEIARRIISSLSIGRPNRTLNP